MVWVVFYPRCVIRGIEIFTCIHFSEPKFVYFKSIIMFPVSFLRHWCSFLQDISINEEITGKSEIHFVVFYTQHVVKVK